MNNQTPVPVEPILYDGKLGEQYKIFVLNVCLGLITLGIYHFWGKTRQRRYTTSSFSIFGDRFEYTGYGGQLFWGMLKALVIILIFSIPAFWAFHNIDVITTEYKNTHKEETTESTKAKESTIKKDFKEDEIDIDKLPAQQKSKYLISLSIASFYVIFFYAFLPFVAVYGSLRYRVTHSRWRGIRGHMGGSTILYGLYGLFHLFLIILTFGLWIPMADALKYKYKMHRISFGNQNAIFKPDYGNLFGTHLLSWFGGCIVGLIVGLIIGFTLYAVLPDGQFASITDAQTSGLDAQTSKVAAKAGVATACGVFAGFFCIFAARFWYKAAFVRMRYNALTFGNIGFNCQISGWGLFKQTFGNGLIYIFTLGLGYPIVLQRKMKFFCKHTTITGDMNNSPILQAVGEKDTQGEGISSILDISIGLF